MWPVKYPSCLWSKICSFVKNSESTLAFPWERIRYNLTASQRCVRLCINLPKTTSILSLCMSNVANSLTIAWSFTNALYSDLASSALSEKIQENILRVSWTCLQVKRSKLEWLRILQTSNDIVPWAFQSTLP